MRDLSAKSKWFGLTTSKKPLMVAQAEWDVLNVDRNAGNVRDALRGCKFIIEVDWKKIFLKDSGPDTPYSWNLRTEFREQYTFPFRDLGDHSVVIEMRGLPDKNQIFVTNAFGYDHVFVGTNNEHDATMIGLRYA